MAFALHAHSLPGADDYSAACRLWDTRPQFMQGRGKARRVVYPKWRQLRDNHSTHLWMCRLDDGAIQFGYHGTPLVTHHPDNSISFRPWRSVSSNIFAERFTPINVCTWFNHSMGPIVVVAEPGGYGWKWGIGSKAYRADTDFRVWPRTGQVNDKFEQISLFTLDRARARQVLKATRYHDFQAWLFSRSKLDAGWFRDARGTSSNLHRTEMAAALARGVEPDDAFDGGWNALSAALLGWHRRPDFERLRRALYADQNLVSEEQVDFILRDKIDSVSRAQCKYRYL